MEGPTPVSALIHAATMVTAGVYMVARAHVLFELSSAAMLVVAVIGALTLLDGGVHRPGADRHQESARLQHGEPTGLYVPGLRRGAFSAAIFHLMTHAFFKALLFLGAGSVIHALDGEQDIRRMGGLQAALPRTSNTFVIGALAIAGIFPFAGFFSKDAILYSAMTAERGGVLLWLAGAAGALMTAFYMFRLLFRVFFGTCNLSLEEQQKVHESPQT